MPRTRVYSDEKILKAASELFLRDGPQASTLEIARRAEVSEGIIFKRFQTKEALFRAAMELEMKNESWRENLLARIGQGEPAANLEAALLALLAKLETIMPKLMVLRGAGHRPCMKKKPHEGPPVRDARALAEYFEGENRRGRLQIAQPLVQAHQIIGSIAHYAGTKEMDGFAPCGKEEYVRELVRIHLPPRRRRSPRALAALLLLLPAWNASADEKAEALTWMQCVKEASLNNPGIAASLKGLQNKEMLRKGAYSSYFPQVTATSSASRSYNPIEIDTQSSTSGENVVATSFGSSSSQSEYSNSYSVGITIQQQIFDGFRTKGNIDQAKAEAAVALAQVLTEKALVSYELKSAFAQLLYAQELVGMLQSIVAQRELNARMVGLKYDIGRENKGALLLSEANLSQARLDLEQAGRTVKVSQFQLQTAMGRRVFRAVQANGHLVTTPVGKEPDFQTVALKTPNHFQQTAAVEASKAGITVAQADFYPQISASFSYTGNDNNSFIAPNSWTVGLNGSLAVFDGGSTYFNVRAARATLQQQQATLRSTDADTAQSLAEDYTDYISAVENVRVSRDFLEASELRAKIAEAQYRNGLISFQDFDTITNDYITRQKTELQSRRDAVLAEAQWEESRGVGAIP